MAKKIYSRGNDVSLTCGLGVVGDFSFSKSESWEWNKREVLQAPEKGTGFFVAGFIDTNVCEKAYKQLCEKYTLIYQSPVRTNRNTYNQFFFCIFDRK